MNIKYATTQTFGGQRASMGRTVLLQYDEGLCVGIVIGLSATDLQVRDMDDLEFQVFLLKDYYDARTHEDLDAMQPGQWCWPPRI